MDPEYKAKLKLAREALRLLKAQVKYEELRKSPGWESLPKEIRDRLDEIHGGPWLTGNEEKEINKLLKS